MALNKAGLVSALEAAGFTNASANTVANAIDTYVKTATVTIDAVGVATIISPTGPCTGSATGTLQ